MILQQNIPLYNFFIFTTLFLSSVISLFFTFIGKVSFTFSFMSILAGGVSFFVFRALKLRIISFDKSGLEEEEEKNNLLSESIAAKKAVLCFLPQIRRKTSLLFNASQNLIELTNCEEIYDFLINSLGEFFPGADSVLFFTFNKEKDSLSLVRSLKRKASVIKEKKGSSLDKWVLHHNCSLLIEDLTKDFRFDYSKIEAYRERKAQSFIISPLSAGSRFLGIIRVESEKPSSFTLDGLRLLRNICDLGAVVIERVNLFERAQDLAIKDSLTSLYSRDYFFQRLAEERGRLCDKNSRIGILMIDIDDFKKINDTYGHIVGDFVLKKLAQSFKSIAGEAGNVICRYGGEEFIILVAECDKEKLLRLGEEIRRKAQEAELIFRRRRINFTVSLGAVFCFGDQESAEGLVSRVDKLMYTAKKKGKNRLCFSE